MAWAPHIKEKARQLRTERSMTIDELAERLALSRTTVYHWVRDLPIERDHERMAMAQRAASRATSEKARLIREAAYRQGLEEFDTLALDPTFRDFVCLYIGEGYKRSRNRVSLCNSDPQVVSLASRWINRLATNEVRYSIQFHADQDLDSLRAFWAFRLGIDAELIRFQRKSNSNQLAGRTWRSKWGVFNVIAGDTRLRARLQAWIDLTKDSWPAG